MDPDARFCGDPVKLLPSYHRTQLVALNEDRHDFAQAWRGTIAGQGPAVRPLDPFLVDYPRLGRRGPVLQAMLGRVSREQVHLIVFDDLRAYPHPVWRPLRPPSAPVVPHDQHPGVARLKWALRPPADGQRSGSPWFSVGSPLRGGRTSSCRPGPASPWPTPGWCSWGQATHSRCAVWVPARER